MCNVHYQRWLRRGTTDAIPRPSFADRFWSKVDKDGPVPTHRPALGPCYLWQAATGGGGYGKFFLYKVDRRAKFAQAHRVAYELEIGPIPVGLELDHLCRVRLCVRPSHLEPVDHFTNVVRGESPVVDQLAVTHCPAGHEYDLVNTYWYGNNRKCRICREVHRQAHRDRVARRKALAAR